MPSRARPEPRFLELFASRDDRPVEAETTIIQALTMMNGTYIEGATNPETSQVLGAIVERPVPGYAGPDRNALPGDAHPPAEG